MNKALGIIVVALGIAAERLPGQDAGMFANPILAGFYPDPSICKVGGDYYLVTSSFSYFPGIPVFQSKDLVNWTQIGAVLDRPEQLNLEGQGVSRGLFAHAIRSSKGTFYVTCTLVDIGGNFVATAKDPAGPWSDPVWIPEVNGIDPSLFFDDEGEAYLLYNSVAPDNTPLYDGHRTIRMYAFDVDSLKVKGSERLLVNGGTDLSKKPIWIEAPHIFRKGGYYYLICAEGGTADQHSEVVFRSADVWGPYVAYGGNPILTQRHLDPARAWPITTTGHADLVETDTGQWWAVFLGCRPYRMVSTREEYFNTGRETFLAPVEWKGGWPIINPDHETVQFHYPYHMKPSRERPPIPLGGNFRYRDEFDGDRLGLTWMFLRTPHEQWHSLSDRRGALALRLRPETASGKSNPTFLGRRQQHLRGSATIALDFEPAGENEKAGLMVFQNESHFYLLCRSVQENHPVVQLHRSTALESSGHGMELLASKRIPSDSTTIVLRIEARGDTYAFWYAVQPGEWMLLSDAVDATFLSTRVAGGFVGCVYAVYASSLGAPSRSTAFVDWFEYVGDDEMYR